MAETAEELAEAAWHASGGFTYAGERLYWGKAHDRLFKILYHASGIDPEGMASVFLWVATKDGRECMKALRAWFAGADRESLLLSACMLDVAEDFDEINETAQKVFDAIDASDAKPLPGGEGGSIQPGK